MRILYGICGEGFGHSSRAKEIITHLQKQGHKILIITYGQAYPVLKTIAKEIIKVQGFHLKFKDNKLSIKKTIRNSIKATAKNLSNFNKIQNKMNNFKPRLCISDMEPLVPIISHWYKLPLISIDNQHRLTHMKLKVPKKYQYYYKLAKAWVKICIKKANAFIILSFVKQKPNSKNTYIVSPILRKEILKLKPKIKNYILIYLTKQNNKLISMLKTIKEDFIIYGYNINKKENNLQFKPSGKHFIKDLANCKAIIASAGFTLISESLYLKKPYFAIPLHGQFEQTLNTLFLKNSSLGTYSESPTKTQIQNFLNSLHKYKARLKHYKSNPNEAIFTLDKILNELKNKKSNSN